jgi:hypothetical protein
MAQNANTVTNANPTPPTNLSFVGNTPPLDPAQAAVDDGFAFNASTNFSLNEPSTNRTTFAAKTAAANTAGAPGAGISNDGEGKGTETSFTQTYSSSIFTPGGATVMVGSGPALPAAATGFGSMPMPNQTHASTLSPATNPTLTSISPTTAVSGATGTDTITATGTGFNKQSVIYRDGVKMTTTYVSATSLTAVVTKRTSAGASSITVVTGGVVTTAAQTLTYS